MSASPYSDLYAGQWRARPSLSQLIIERVQAGPCSVADLAGSLHASAESIARILRRHRANGWMVSERDGVWSAQLRPDPEPVATEPTYWPK